MAARGVWGVTLAVGYEYDLSDRLVAITYPSGRRVDYARDGAGRISGLTLDGATTLADAFAYLPFGPVSAYTFGSGETLTRAYDPNYWLTDVTSPALALHFARDAVGNIQSLTDAQGGSLVEQYAYDALYRLTAVQDPVGALIEGYTYDATGNRLSKATAAGTEPYTYPATSHHLTDVGGQVRTYDAVGNTLTEAESFVERAATGESLTWGSVTGDYTATHANDGAVQAITEESTSGKPTERVSRLRFDWTFDVAPGATVTFYANAWVSSSTDGDQVEYSYSTDGTSFTNLLTESRTADDDSYLSAALPPGTSGTVFIRVEDTDRTPGNTATDTIFVDRLYLRTEQATGAGNSRSYSYDDRNRLVAVTGPTSAQYQYNGKGERVRKSAPGTTLFVYGEAGSLLGEYAADGTVRQEYVYADALPIAVLAAGGTYFVHADHLGSPRAVSNVTGTKVWAWTVEGNPFGEVLPDEDPDGDGTAFTLNLRFPGQYYDAESNLHYNYFRDYDPATGRYIESDPIGLDAGINTYEYAFSNPYRYFDLVGLEGCGSGWNEPIPDNPYGFRFSVCCDWNDDCYGTCDASLTMCDNTFCECTKNMCRFAFTIFTYLFCAGLARQYCFGVKKGGQPYYDEGQKDCPTRGCGGSE